jgi:hypothetical protein
MITPPNQIAPVNRCGRSPIRLGWEFGHVINDSRHIPAAVTELRR